jgi:hypothetical protein
MTTKLFLMLGLVGALVRVGPAQAATSCHMIEAKGVGQDDGTGKSTGKVIGGGLLQGTLEGAVTPTSPPIDGVVTFIEIVKFTNERGDINGGGGGRNQHCNRPVQRLGFREGCNGQTRGCYWKHRILRYRGFHDGPFHRKYQGCNLRRSGTVVVWHPHENGALRPDALALASRCDSDRGRVPGRQRK